MNTALRIHHQAAAIVAAAFVFTTVGPVAAQETRAEYTQLAQASKQSAVTPPKPNRFEILIDRLERKGVFTGAPPQGFYPWMGSVYPGSGFTLGLGVRKPFGDDGAVRTFGAHSISRSTRLESEVALPTFARRRARVSFGGQYIDAASVKFYGIGNDSAKADLTYFGVTPKRAGVRLDVDPAARLSLGGGVSYLAIDTSSGRTGPPIESRFQPGEVPGLDSPGIDYINSSVRGAFDWRRPLGYSGSGGFYRLQLDDYRESRGGAHSFRSLEGEVQQLFPVMRANWVVALRGLATLTNSDAQSEIPFYLLPSLGGGHTLRGYPDFRFRDRHRLLMSAELRWTPARFIDMAVFYDSGKVAARRQELDFDDLKDSYGIGARLVGPRGYALRVEVARSREHAARLLINAGGGF